MIITREDFKAHFDQMKDRAADGGLSLLMLVAPDVDGICAAQVLASVLKQDNIDHKITPVSGYLELQKQFLKETRFGLAGSQLRTVILVNCGASVDLSAVLGEVGVGYPMPPDLHIYVVDVYRPVYHKNLRTDANIYVLDMHGIEDLDALVPQAGDSEDEDGWKEEFGDRLQDTDEEGEGEEGEEEEEEEVGEEEEAEEGEGEEEEEGEGEEGEGEEAEEGEEDQPSGEGGEEAMAAQGTEEAGGSSSSSSSSGVVGAAGGRKRRRAQPAKGSRSSGGEAASVLSSEDGSSSSSSSSSAGEEGARGRRQRRLRRLGGSSAASGPPGGRQQPLETVLRRQRRAAYRRYRRYYLGEAAAAAPLLYGGPGASLPDQASMHLGLPAAFQAWGFVKCAVNSTRRDLLWLAIVGVTAHYLSEGLSSAAYGELQSELHRDVEAVRPAGGEGGEGGGGGGSSGGGGAGGLGSLGRSAQSNSKEGMIEDAPFEPRLFAHRHWTLYDSIRCSEYVSTRLQTWREARPGVPGELDMLIAHCSTSPALAKTHTSHVPKADRHNFFDKLLKEVSQRGPLWRMDPEGLFYPSFTRTLDLNEPVRSAADYVHALQGLLAEPRGRGGGAVVAGAPPGSGAPGSSEGGGSSEGSRDPKLWRDGWADSWQRALQALSRRNTELLESGLEHCKALRTAILRIVPNIVRGSKMRSGGSMRWVDVGEDLTEAERALFSHPCALAELGRYLVRVYRDSLLRWRRRDTGEVIGKPLLVYLRQKRGSALFGSGADDGGWVTVMALPVAGEGGDAAFRVGLSVAAANAGCDYVFDNFGNTTLIMRADHIMNFFSQMEGYAIGEVV